MNRKHWLGGLVAGIWLWAGSGAATESGVPDLMAPGLLSEIAFGNHGAPITVIEYASISCEECRSFHLNVWPVLKKKYIDTGKVHFIYRELPADPAAEAGFMLARCAGNARWHNVIDLLYQTQASWRQSSEPEDALLSVMSRTGMAGRSFSSCLKDQDLRKQLDEVAADARRLGVTTSPAMVINGTVYSGTHSLVRIENVLQELIRQP